MYFVVIYSLQPLFVVLLPRRTSGHFYSHVNLSGIHVPLKYLCINAKITYLNLCCEKDPQIWTRRVSFLLWRAAGSRIPSQFTPSHFKQHQYSVASAVLPFHPQKTKVIFCLWLSLTHCLGFLETLHLNPIMTSHRLTRKCLSSFDLCLSTIWYLLRSITQNLKIQRNQIRQNSRMRIKSK